MIFGRGAAATALLSALSTHGSSGIEVSPARPCNVTVASMSTGGATVTWKQGEGGGVPTHYTAKWQAKDGIELNWYPDYVGVGHESLTISNLAPAMDFAVQVAAINKQGRAWSDLILFSTLEAIPCEESFHDAFHWGAIIDSNDVDSKCRHDLGNRRPSDPDPRSCSVGSFEYILAGIAAGCINAFMLLGVFLRCRSDAQQQKNVGAFAGSPANRRVSRSGGEVISLPKSHVQLSDGRLRRLAKRNCIHEAGSLLRDAAEGETISEEEMRSEAGFEVAAHAPASTAANAATATAAIASIGGAAPSSPVRQFSSLRELPVVERASSSRSEVTESRAPEICQPSPQQAQQPHPVEQV